MPAAGGSCTRTMQAWPPDLRKTGGGEPQVGKPNELDRSNL